MHEMTTSELVKALAVRMGINQREARSLLDNYIAAIVRQLSMKNSVTLRNFGSFTIKTITEKRAYPCTGIKMPHPCSRKAGLQSCQKAP